MLPNAHVLTVGDLADAIGVSPRISVWNAPLGTCRARTASADSATRGHWRIPRATALAYYQRVTGVTPDATSLKI